MKHHLVWFRNDLRVNDNPALAEACRDAAVVSAVYIDCDRQRKIHGQSDIQWRFIKQHLMKLSSELKELNISFKVVRASKFSDCASVIQKFIAEYDVDAIFANMEVGIDEVNRDKHVELSLDIPVKMYAGGQVVIPGSLTTKSGRAYEVFTPFAKEWIRRVSATPFTIYPKPLPRENIAEIDIGHNCDFLVEEMDWPIGEDAALNQLEKFCEQKVLSYQDDRDYPYISGTSKLSPYLSIGVLSPSQAIYVLRQRINSMPTSKKQPGYTWLSEIIWREFYHHLMFNFPHLSKGMPFKPYSDFFPWKKDQKIFTRWCEGKTGYPIVDAAMRALNETGWMHNRLRMVVASFLTKNLHIDWRWGEQYFMNKLIDADFASNNGGWQWSAGSGADAAPYFRVFNPVTQSTRFDPDGRFIKKWIPELSEVPSKYIHFPYQYLKDNGATGTYPPPIVSHSETRKQAIEYFAAAKKKGEQYA